MIFGRASEPQEARFEEIYREYGPAIFTRCRKLLADDAAAEDATQETFMRVHRHIAKAPSSREALFWIYRIATNYCLNELRDRKRRPESRAILPEPPGEDPAQRLADRDLAAHLIRGMTPKLAEVAWLHYVDGIEQGQVAEILGVSRRTVINRLQAFLAKSRKLSRRAA